MPKVVMIGNVFLEYSFSILAIVSGLLLVIYSDRITTKISLDHPSLSFLIPYWLTRFRLIGFGIFLILGGIFAFFL